MRGPSLEDSLMGVGRGYSAYVLGTRNIFLFRSAKQERETKLERGSAGTLNLRTRKKLFIQERGNAVVSVLCYGDCDVVCVLW